MVQFLVGTQSPISRQDKKSVLQFSVLKIKNRRDGVTPSHNLTIVWNDCWCQCVAKFSSSLWFLLLVDLSENHCLLHVGTFTWPWLRPAGCAVVRQSSAAATGFRAPQSAARSPKFNSRWQQNVCACWAFTSYEAAKPQKENFWFQSNSKYFKMSAKNGIFILLIKEPRMWRLCTRHAARGNHANLGLSEVFSNVENQGVNIFSFVRLCGCKMCGWCRFIVRNWSTDSLDTGPDSCLFSFSALMDCPNIEHSEKMHSHGAKIARKLLAPKTTRKSVPKTAP